GLGDPPRGRVAASGDLGFLKFAVFPADNGTFSITLAVPEVEERLRAAVVRPEILDQICQRLPGIAPWTDPAHSRAVSKVHAMGELESRWRDFVVGGRPAARNLFSVGDSLARTNPLYGRGCSFAVIEAHLLRDVLCDEADPDARALAYDRLVRRELRPFYDDMVRQDRSAAKRAQAELDPDAKPSLRSRLIHAFVEDGVAIALRQDIELFRQAMRAFHMLAPPARWLLRPATLAKVMRVWARGRRANAPLYREPPGPRRPEMLAALGLPATAKLA
ncbi:MAG TPA: FAD-dependent oxidoreductase, partial [Caulobacteraceae bacterium]